MNREPWGDMKVNHPGIATAFELAMRFHLWATSLHRDPTNQEIMTKFGVSRATAYRWLNGWNAAKGICGQSVRRAA